MSDRPRGTPARDALWQRTAAVTGFAVAALVLAFHTRVSLPALMPHRFDFSALPLLPGPAWALSWLVHGGRLLAAAVFFLSLPGLGRLCLPRKLDPPPFAAAGAGLLAWSLLGLGLAAAGLSRPLPLRIISLAVAAAGAVKGFPLLRALPRPRELRLSAAGVGLGAFAALYLLTTLVPETFYDALVYHLAAPMAWLQSGRLTDMPDVHLWRLPGLMQPVYLWALAWSDDRLCKVLNVGVGLLAAGHLGSWAAGRWGARTGRWAALLFLSSPLVGVNLWSCANDVPAGFFAFLSLTLWLEAWEPSEGPSRPRLFLSGLLFGAGIAAKGTALFAAPYFLLDGLRRGRRGAALPLAAFGAGFLLPLLPWWVRTGLWTGNPFFPQAAGLLGGDRPENVALLAGWHAEAGGAGGILFRAASLLRESVVGIDSGRFGFIGPVLLMLLPLAFFLAPDPAHGALAAYALAAYAAFIPTTGRLRYFLPHLPALFAAAAACLTDFTAAAGRFPGKIVPRLARWLPVLVGAAVAMNFLWLALVFGRFNQGWPVIWGRQAPSAYLREEHIGVYGHPSQGAYDFLRESGAQGRLFVIGEARTYRSPLPTLAAASFNVPLYVDRAGDPPSAVRLLEELKREGFTYLLINVAEMRRITPGPYKSPAYLQALGTLFDRLPPPLYRDAWCILFRLP